MLWEGNIFLICFFPRVKAHSRTGGPREKKQKQQDQARIYPTLEGGLGAGKRYKERRGRKYRERVCRTVWWRGRDKPFEKEGLRLMKRAGVGQEGKGLFGRVQRWKRNKHKKKGANYHSNLGERESERAW